MLDRVVGNYLCPRCGVRKSAYRAKFDKKTKLKTSQKRGFYWGLACPYDGSEVQLLKEEKKILPKVHFDARCWVVLSMDGSQFIDFGIKEAKMRKKYPLYQIIDGSSANKMMGLDDRGYPI